MEEQKTPQGLSKEGREILVAAANRGEVVVLEAEQLGRWVASGSHDFVDQKDPAVAAVGFWFTKVETSMGSRERDSSWPVC